MDIHIKEFSKCIEPFSDPIKDILKHAQEKYIDFNRPQYSFINPLLLSHWELYKQLIGKYSVKDDTDFNCDVCFHYYLDKEDNSWEVCVSLVGPYAMVTKENDGHWSVLSDPNLCSDTADIQLLNLLKDLRFTALNKETLKTIIPGFPVECDEEVSDGKKNEAFIYEILFFQFPLTFLGDR